MNHCAQSGYIGQDLILKKTNEGKSVLNFSVGVRKSKDKTVWINCTAFEQKADFIVTNFKKGSFIIVESDYDCDVVEKDGHKFNYPRFTVKSVDFGGSKKESEVERSNPPYEPTEEDEIEPTIPIDIDDLGF